MAKKCVAIKDGLDRAVREAVAVLNRGGVVIFPTETVYGVGVASADADALSRLRRLKNRDAGKPFQYLAADMAMAAGLGAVFSPRAAGLARAFWPGPMTLVVPDGAGGTLGIRIPASEFVLALCRGLGRPVISSSANPAGAPAPSGAGEADAFGDGADLLVDGGEIAHGVPSTVVCCAGDEFHILRHGGVSGDAIRAVWEE